MKGMEMEICTKVNSSKVKLTGKESINGQMAKFTMANGCKD